MAPAGIKNTLNSVLNSVRVCAKNIAAKNIAYAKKISGSIIYPAISAGGLALFGLICSNFPAGAEPRKPAATDTLYDSMDPNATTIRIGDGGVEAYVNPDPERYKPKPPREINYNKTVGDGGTPPASGAAPGLEERVEGVGGAAEGAENPDSENKPIRASESLDAGVLSDAAGIPPDGAAATKQEQSELSKGPAGIAAEFIDLLDLPSELAELQQEAEEKTRREIADKRLEAAERIDTELSPEQRYSGLEKGRISPLLVLNAGAGYGKFWGFNELPNGYRIKSSGSGPIFSGYMLAGPIPISSKLAFDVKGLFDYFMATQGSGKGSVSLDMGLGEKDVGSFQFDASRLKIDTSARLLIGEQNTRYIATKNIFAALGIDYGLDIFGLTGTENIGSNAQSTDYLMPTAGAVMRLHTGDYSLLEEFWLSAGAGAARQTNSNGIDFGFGKMYSVTGGYSILAGSFMAEIEARLRYSDFGSVMTSKTAGETEAEHSRMESDMLGAWAGGKLVYYFNAAFGAGVNANYFFCRAQTAHVRGPGGKPTNTETKHDTRVVLMLELNLEGEK